MFNKKIKELKQRITELEKTCDDLEMTIDFKNDVIKNLVKKDAENNYRIALLEKEKSELNNVISNLMEEKNKSEVKKIAKKRSVRPANRNTSK